MDLAVNITSSCRVKVLLVPVAPIKKSTFGKHVELVKQFDVVRLGDVTPDLQNGASAKFSSQVFQEGQMHFQFVTSYRRDHAHLEDFQPHRRIFGVIGIMDCQEWKNRDLSEGYKHFVNTLNKYPTAIATRCFAFDPTENQPDDTKGLIMIPNVGNLSFYMGTMICDFASEILCQFSKIAGRIEQLPSLESPMQVQYQATSKKAPYHQQSQQQHRHHDQITNNAPPTVSPQPSSSTSTGARMQPRPSQPPSSPAPTSSISSTFSKHASSMAPGSSNDGNIRPSPTYNKMAALPPMPAPSVSRTINNQGTSDSTKTKRRTPGRIKKLFADFYLLAGRLPDAVSHYQHAIEITKSTSDFLWLASAMEGLACATLLLEYLQGDVGHIVSRKIDPPSPTESPMSPTTNNKDHGMEDISLKPAPSSFTEVIDQYTALIQYYNKVNTTSSIPLPGLVYAEACTKVSRLLLTVYMNKGWNDHVLSLVVQGKILPSAADINGSPQSSVANAQPLNTTLSSLPGDNSSFNKPSTPVSISRFEIAEWVMRVWSIQIDQLPLLDQINFMTQMSTILSSIEYHRKAAWCMHESVRCMLPLLFQGRTTLSNSQDLYNNGSGKDSHGVLQILKRICEVYGIGERNVLDGGALCAIQQQQQEEQDKLSQRGSACNGGGGDYKENTRLGWATLQIDILRQCIAVSEALPDYGSMLYYTTVLLKNLYQFIPKDEQIRLASFIQRIVSIGKRSGLVESNVNYWGVNIVTHIEAVQAIPRKAVYEYPIIDKSPVTTTSSGDPFIYNPFAQKKNQKDRINLVKNELAEFKVTLTNPFGFDLELQNATLSTAGIPFTPLPISASIPSYGTMSLRLTGTPEESGTLVIRGCTIKIVGFAEQEFIYNTSPKKLDQGNNKSTQEPSNVDAVKYKYSGLRAIQNAIKKRGDSREHDSPAEYYKVQVIDKQPLLKLTSTSLLHGAVMLYEGEVTHIKMEIENIGKIPVDFITLSFTDSTSSNPLPINPELPMEQQYELELFIKGIPVFSWDGSGKDMAQSIGKKVYLAPGMKTEIVVNVYGKRGCSGGTIQMDYGYLDRLPMDSFGSTLTSPEITSPPSSPTSQTSTPASFFTRQLYLPVLVTVYQNLEPLHWDVLYLRQGGGGPNANKDKNPANQQDDKPIFCNNTILHNDPTEDLILWAWQVCDLHQDKNDYCLVTMDIRNTWTVPFDVSFKVIDGLDHYDNSNITELMQTTLCIQPGSTRRVVLPVKRMFLSAETCNQPIPSFEPNKQFVVAQGPKMAPEHERARSHMFWYREKLLERIQASWQCQATGRNGVINLRPSLRLTSQQLAILKKEDIEFLVDLNGPTVKKADHRQFQCDCDEFVSMAVSIRNRQVRPVKLILRVQPVQSYNNGAKEYDLSGKLLVQGLQQIVLPEIPAGALVTHAIPLYFLSKGRFEFLYHVEDVHTRDIYYDHDWALVDSF